MHPVSSRLYKDEKDALAMLDLITRVRRPEHRSDYPVKVDIEENLASAFVRANARLWFHEDRPIAWGFVDEFNNLWWELDRRYEELVGIEIVAWGETCIRKSLVDGGTSSLDTACREDHVERISFLHRHGFSQTEATTIRMACSLEEEIPLLALPPGFTIRPIAGVIEAEAVAATHRAAFGTEYMTADNRLAIMNTSAYDPSLDLVAIAPDGTLVANCICSVNKNERRGSTDPVLTHPRFQRLGLARALLVTGMKLLRDRGMRSVQLGTSGDNLAMQRTAVSVGFTLECKTLWFSKEVKYGI